MIKKLQLQQNLLGLISANVDAGAVREGDRRLHFLIATRFCCTFSFLIIT
jgi:hypothetical protein